MAKVFVLLAIRTIVETCFKQIWKKKIFGQAQNRYIDMSYIESDVILKKYECSSACNSDNWHLFSDP